MLPALKVKLSLHHGISDAVGKIEAVAWVLIQQCIGVRSHTKGQVGAEILVKLMIKADGACLVSPSISSITLKPEFISARVVRSRQLCIRRELMRQLDGSIIKKDGAILKVRIIGLDGVDEPVRVGTTCRYGQRGLVFHYRAVEQKVTGDETNTTAAIPLLSVSFP